MEQLLTSTNKQFITTVNEFIEREYQYFCAMRCDLRKFQNIKNLEEKKEEMFKCDARLRNLENVRVFLILNFEKLHKISAKNQVIQS